jgi:hypothetical protein
MSRHVHTAFGGIPGAVSETQGDLNHAVDSSQSLQASLVFKCCLKLDLSLEAAYVFFCAA